ncbi:hypothetical protein [Priestia megaterium]|nr:hypothetical protein [Priestia megaterium]
MSENIGEKQPSTRAEMRRGHLAIQHRILNALIVLVSIAIIYLAIKAIF